MIDRVLSVSELTNQIKATLSNSFTNIKVEGEISNLTNHQSGHSYFSLKDEQSSIKCVMFKSARLSINFELEQGLMVNVEGYISVYMPRGEYQIICTSIRKSGIGDLALKYEALKDKLDKKGYFKKENKKQLPLFPKKIALLTSKSGAVVHDMLMVANKRWRLIELTLIDTIVQGNIAKESIVHNITLSDSMGFDIIVIARGGGSIEDLWAFNEEMVADAIFSAKTPIVSAIGHEVDYVLSDFVADLRAPTPSACMELILPDSGEYLLHLSDMMDNLNIAQRNTLEMIEDKLDNMKTNLSFYKFDFEKNSKYLNDIENMIYNIMNKFFNRGQEDINNTKVILEYAYKSIEPSKDMLLEKNILNLNHSMELYLKNKSSVLLLADMLNDKITLLIENKYNILKHLESIIKINSKQTINKHIQITKDNKIIDIKSLKKGDNIVISDLEYSKNALII